MKKIKEFEKKYDIDHTILSKILKNYPKGTLAISGEDYEIVKRVYEQNTRRLWTVVKTNKNGLKLVQGLENKNSVYHIVTIQNCENINEEYLIE